MRQAVRHSISGAAAQILGEREGAPSPLAGDLAPLLSLLLYLSSQPDEIGSPGQRPANPQPKRTKQGWRLFAADKATTWEVGVRIGAALRRAYQRAETAPAGDGGGERAGPRAHVRSAHWHGFRSGPTTRDDGSPVPTHERRFELRWLPPIPVNVGELDELPAVVRKVRDGQ